MKHVHIASVSPRTGTTLMMELMVSSFEFGDCPVHEHTLLIPPISQPDLYCSKCPAIDDVRIAYSALNQNPDLWIIGMVRDPRDVVVSRHGYRPDLYWGSLGVIKERSNYFRRAMQHPRFILVRYEDLVSDPDKIQEMLKSKIPFLKQKAKFSDFSKEVAIPKQAVHALNGTRAVSTKSIERWRNELPRLKGQIAKYGPIDKLMRELGYEIEDGWDHVMDDVEPDLSESYHESGAKSRTIFSKAKSRIWRWWLRLRFRAGFPLKTNVPMRGDTMG